MTNLSQFAAMRISTTNLQNMASPDTLNIAHLSSLQLCHLIEMNYDHRKGEKFYVHDLTNCQEKEILERSVDISAGDSLSLLLVLISVSTQCMAEVVLGQNANM